MDWALASELKGYWFISQPGSHAWVAGQVHSRGHVRGNHTLMFLSLCPSLPSPSKNKFQKLKKKEVPVNWPTIYLQSKRNLTFFIIRHDYINYKYFLPTPVPPLHSNKQMCSTKPNTHSWFNRIRPKLSVNVGPKFPSRYHINVYDFRLNYDNSMLEMLILSVAFRWISSSGWRFLDAFLSPWSTHGIATA